MQFPPAEGSFSKKEVSRRRKIAIAIGSIVELFKSPDLQPDAMRTALAFAAIIIVFGIFMPDVLNALTTFLLAFFGKATAMVQSLPTAPVR